MGQSANDPPPQISLCPRMNQVRSEVFDMSHKPKHGWRVETMLHADHRYTCRGFDRHATAWIAGP
jgi:hypothetical protein